MIEKKRYKAYQLLVFLVLLIITFFALGAGNNIFAANASINISTETATQGGDVVITVTINADSSIGAYDFYLEYDPDILEAVSGYTGGGGGRVEIMYWSPTSDGNKTISVPITFKAKAPGTSEIKYVTLNQNNGVIDFDTEENMALTAKDGSVTVKAPVVASGNNNLSSLTVAAVKSDGSSYDVNLTPGFSKDVTSYNIQAEEGVVKLAITAKAEDAKASVKVEWANLDPGENTTKVIVTAENGSTKQYKIYTRVPVPETTTPAPEETITVDIGGVQHYIEDIDDAVTLPEGFETEEYDYKGETVIVGKGLSKELIVMYVTNGDGSAGSLYIYNETKDTFYPMINIEMTQKLYTVVEMPDDASVPAGFDECTVNVGEMSFQGWKNKDIEGIYLVYAMNWDGQAGFYFYDEVEKQMIKYFDTSVEAGATLDSYNELLKENEKLKDDIEKLQNEQSTQGMTGGNDNDDKAELYKYIAIGCGVAVIILIGVIIVLLTKNKDDEENDETDIKENDEENGTVEEAASEETTEEAVLGDVATEEAVTGETASEEIIEEETTSEAIISEESPSEETEENSSEEAHTEQTSREVTEVFRDILFGGKLKEEVSEEITPEAPILEETVTTETEVDMAEPEEVKQEEATVEEIKMEEAAIEETAIIEEATIEGTETEKSEIEEVATEEPETEETVTEESVTEVIEPENTVTEEPVAEENGREEHITPAEEKKRKVVEILNDEESSINKEDMDFVIDELFDELFGE